MKKKLQLFFVFMTILCSSFVSCGSDDEVVSSGDNDGNNNGTNSIYVVNGVTFKMIKVKGGTFQMGATSEQSSYANDDEKPAHQVTLSDYYIGETEVTQELWQVVMGSNASLSYDSRKLPVSDASWDACQTFITKLNKLTGQKFRMPTEAEWEFAARGGNASKGYIYSGSNDIGIVAWYCNNSNGKDHEVGMKAPNELGLYDMSGNAREWCQDWYSIYGNGPQTNPTGPELGTLRVCRGGTVAHGQEDCRVSWRDQRSPSYIAHQGLRLAL